MAADNEKTTSQSNRGISRRALLGSSAGGLAAAVVFGSGVRAATAAPATSGRLDESKLRSVDPHANTGAVLRRPRREGASVRILPVARATFQAGFRFDLRVEAAGVDPESARIRVKLRDPQGRPAHVLVGEPRLTSSADDAFEATWTDVIYPSAGEYTVEATVLARGGVRADAEVTHDVRVADTSGRKAKNVIFFLGDGMGQSPITAARIMSKGMTEGRYHGLLEMDQMDYRGLVTTSGIDSIATDSANSMSAYMTGHKSSVNAMGVYVGNAAAHDDHPRVETLSEVLRRTRGSSIGVVSTAEIQDATPAAVWAHTRQRSQYIAIMDQALEEDRTPDVLLGGGRASFLPQSVPGSRRSDDRDLINEFEDLGFAYAGTREELEVARAGNPEKLLGLFHLGNLNVYLDRQHSPDPEVLGEFTDQPNLVEMTEAALEVLERRTGDEGFLLVVEAASIDKMEHPLDGPRAVYDTIEFDQALGVAKRWAEEHGDTLIVVTADHNHSMSIVGTQDVTTGGRAGNGVYAAAGFPTYVDSNGDGFPDDPNADVQLFFGWSNHPDHTDDFAHNDVFGQPALLGPDGVAVPNPNRDPDAELQVGNLPYADTNCVHTVEDVAVVASGPGSAGFNGVLDNTDVFHRVIDALGLVVPAEPARGARGDADVRSAG